MKKLSVALAMVLLVAALVCAQAAPSSNGAPAAQPAATQAPATAAPAATAPAATTPAATPAAAPAAAPAVKPAAADMAKAESTRYIVFAESGAARAAALDDRLESLFDLYGSIFHFDDSLLAAKLRVREFKDKAGFDAYLSQVAGQTKDDFVYLHYSNPERSELVLFYKDGEAAEASLDHQAFVQYIKAFVRNPPLWLRDGFAVFFETARWDDKTKTFSFAENLAWLETIKALSSKNALLPLAKLLAISPEEARSSLDVYYPQAWAFASFLLNTDNRDYNRLLWDSISYLGKDAQLSANQSMVLGLVDNWYGSKNIEDAFLAYLDARKTFGELLTMGVSAYGEKSFEEARSAFESAAKMEPSSYVPPYYLGLIAYGAGDYSLAEYSYKSALELGCDAGTANYALGVNAFAQNRSEDAKTYLLAAKTASPDKYGTKADELLGRLGM